MPDSTTTSLSDVKDFLDHAAIHCGATKSDKYAEGRAHEPVDVIVEWTGAPDGFLAGNAIKYLSRYTRTRKLTDLFKAVHYIGMQANADRKAGRLVT